MVMMVKTTMKMLLQAGSVTTVTSQTVQVRAMRLAPMCEWAMAMAIAMSGPLASVLVLAKTSPPLPRRALPHVWLIFALLMSCHQAQQGLFSHLGQQ
jgi:hypothetical protein